MCPIPMFPFQCFHSRVVRFPCSSVGENEFCVPRVAGTGSGSTATSDVQVPIEVTVVKFKVQAPPLLYPLRTTYTADHTPLPYRPLLTQLVEAIFDPSRPDLVDVDHVHGHAVTDILKTGFRSEQSLLLRVGLPSPDL